jgi:glycogen debranching enzyme
MQDKDGMIPHMIFWKKSVKRPYFLAWENKRASSITQPPMLAYAAWEIHRKQPNKAFLEEIYEPLFRYYRYLIERRDPVDDHLIGIINPDESGEDNSPRFDAAIGADTDISFFRHMYERNKLVEKNRVCAFNEEICMRENFWVKDVPFNVIMIRNLQAFGHIASYLGHKRGEHYATEHAKLMREAMRDFMFEDGVFWSTMGKDHTKIKVNTWAHFIPLFADLYSQAEAESLITTHFRNDETFRSQYGIRTVSKQESSYRPDGFWRGPIWHAPQWFIYKGLRAYGYKDEAQYVRNAMERNVTSSNFREYFNPETGEGMGAKWFTWGTLLLDMQDA